MKENYENEKTETEVEDNVKKEYSSPLLTRHEPLDSVSTVYYYYYY